MVQLRRSGQLRYLALRPNSPVALISPEEDVLLQAKQQPRPPRPFHYKFLCTAQFLPSPIAFTFNVPAERTLCGRSTCRS